MKREWKSFANAFQGIILVIKEERHFRFHLLAVAVISMAGWYFKISFAEWITVFLCFGLVLLAEALNSAIEALADAVTLEQHPQIKKAKDIAAGAVLIAALIACVIGGIIFFPKLGELLFN
jgi:undecaprenol kinase/diacylglycerol kinase (ATP)